MRLPSPLSRWLTPPSRLERSHVVLLRGLAIVAVAAGFEGSITSATLTFAADQWGASTAAQGRTLAIIRADILVSLVIVRAADRLGRRRVLLFAAVAGPILTAACATSPNIVVFTGIQVAARGCVTACAILISVLGVESLPAEVRAWASGLLVIAAAIGSGLTLVGLPVADAGPAAWRSLYLVPLLSLPALRLVARSVRESDRFVHQVDERRAQLAGIATMVRTHWRRVATVGLFLALIAFESAPTRQLQNDFLRRERGFTAAGVALFGLATNAPGLIGLLVGGRASDERGRKRVLTVALIGFAVGDAGLYLTRGPTQWGFSVLGSLLGGASLPALGIYAAELFPTSMRSTANGLTAGLSRIGGVAGLLFVSALSTGNHVGGPAALTTGALWLAVGALWFLMPETAGRELEELNPEDAR